MSNKKYSIHNILDYLKNKLSNDKRYSLEKDMNADPFLSDAMDGFSKISPVDLEHDLIHLEKQLQSRTHKTKSRSLAIYWSAAASIAIIISIATLYFITDDTDLRNFEVAQQVTVKPIKDSASVNPVVVSAQASVGDTAKTVSTAKQRIIKREALRITQAKPAAKPKINVVAEQASPQVFLLESQEIQEVDSFVAEMELDEQPLLMSNNYSVKGTVKDNNIPIPGVSVIIKGTDIGTITDTHGEYKIDAKEGDILVYSFIGFERREELVTQNMLAKADVQLNPSNQELQEVVTVGSTPKKLTFKTSSEKVKVQDKDIAIDYANFQDYVTNNKQIDAANSIVVEAEFTLSKRGTIKKIAITTSNTKEVKKEAKRLLKKAPRELLKENSVKFTL